MYNCFSVREELTCGPANLFNNLDAFLDINDISSQDFSLFQFCRTKMKVSFFVCAFCIFTVAFSKLTQKDSSEVCPNSFDNQNQCDGVMCAISDSILYPNGGRECVCICCDGVKPKCVEYSNSTSSGVECQCNKEEEMPEASPEEAEAISTESVPCISTQWIENNDMSHGILKRGGLSSVLCPTGLPCGTPGHLLRECNGVTCDLVTYAEVCRISGDCIESVEHVSQLSNQLDWSKFKVGQLSLTSLSVNPMSSKNSLSRFIAKVTDFMNGNGLGTLSDFVAMIPHRVDMLHKALVSSNFGSSTEL